MILKKIRLHPFGGTADRTYDFTLGLNIIQGPNEAGKSTLFNASQSVFFTRAALGKREFKTGPLM